MAKLIKDVMHHAVTLSPDTDRAALLAIAKAHPDHDLFIVADKDGMFLGDIHENDLFYTLIPDDMFEEIGVDLALDIEKKFFAKTAGELMHKHDLSCKPTDTVMDTALVFLREGATTLPVLDKWGKVMGYVTQGMLLRHLDAA